MSLPNSWKAGRKSGRWASGHTLGLHGDIEIVFIMTAWRQSKPHISFILERASTIDRFTRSGRMQRAL